MKLRCCGGNRNNSPSARSLRARFLFPKPTHLPPLFSLQLSFVLPKESCTKKSVSLVQKCLRIHRSRVGKRDPTPHAPPRVFFAPLTRCVTALLQCDHSVFLQGRNSSVACASE